MFDVCEHPDLLRLIYVNEYGSYWLTCNAPPSRSNLRHPHNINMNRCVRVITLVLGCLLGNCGLKGLGMNACLVVVSSMVWNAHMISYNIRFTFLFPPCLLEGSGATCLAHCDGSSTLTEVPLLVNATASLSNPAKEGRLELHLVGGFDDDSKTSHKLSLTILAAFQKQKEEIHLETCCITDMNDVVTDGIHRPVVYGIGVNVKTGEVFPASFPERGPAEDLRSARTFTGGQMAEVYDSSKEQMKIGPCRWAPSRDIAFWLSEDDNTILQYLSTSPYAEPPHFVQHIKSTIQFLLDHPSADSLFPGGQPQLFQRTEQGEWERVSQQ
ncbi:protein N-terminal asparagine amidohydrolase isoform X1 [Salminus brasiliensis]|uniref:protein N-terminal asparagine amidohydrolase isoform X1 n=1 Tax=Salminus brasiliensis TaxID=930266 RepID=UPI003B82ED67